MSNPATLITERQQAALLSVSHRHLINLRTRRLVPYLKLGKSVRYSPGAVAKALEKLTVKEVS